MFVAGIDAHATYSVIAIVSNTGQLVHGPVRIKNTEEERLDELLEQYRPLEVVVETSLAWPWLFDRLQISAKRCRWTRTIGYQMPNVGEKGGDSSPEGGYGSQRGRPAPSENVSLSGIDSHPLWVP